MRGDRPGRAAGARPGESADASPEESAGASHSQFATSALLNRHLELDDRVALRPESFGALAYHYGNRRLIFLRHPDVLTVVRSLGGHETVADTLRACDIAPARWPSFLAAIESLVRSEVLRECALAG